jgi:hypothetical protein
LGSSPIPPPKPSAGNSRSLFYTTDVPTLRSLYPENQIVQELSADARLIVSEPIGDLPGAWQEMPESSYAVIAAGHDQIHPFMPAPGAPFTPAPGASAAPTLGSSSARASGAPSKSAPPPPSPLGPPSPASDDD